MDNLTSLPVIGLIAQYGITNRQTLMREEIFVMRKEIFFQNAIILQFVWTNKRSDGFVGGRFVEGWLVGNESLYGESP